ncbi:MAG: FtsX-like permease family protein [Candidatus Eisenbacteria bacterium]
MFVESLKLALGNARRSKLRYTLTTLGVMIGTGAIVSMVSFAVGMSKEMARAISSSGLLTTVYVMPVSGPAGRGDPTDPDDRGDDIGMRDAGMRDARHGAQSNDSLSGGGSVEDDSVNNGLSAGGLGASSSRVGGSGADSSGVVWLNDETLARLASIEGVKSVFPLILFPASVSLGGKETFVTVSGMSAKDRDRMSARLEKGEAFAGDEDSTLLVSASLAGRLGINVDSFVSPIPVVLSIVTLRSSGLSSMLSFGFQLPFERKEFQFRLIGITTDVMGGPLGRSEAYVPLGTARRLASTTIRDASEILRNLSFAGGGYPGAEVLVGSLDKIDSIKEEVTKLGLRAFSVSDQLKEVRTGFMIVSGFLGAIGGVALFVGCLGIMNVMLISVLERTGEIGVMKSVGARRGDIRNLFLAEAGLIGVVGGIVGVLLGLAVAEIANYAMFTFTIKDQIPFRRLYDIPVWLSCGAVGLAIVVSVLSGLYPARKAAAMDPVVALRHE